MVLYKLSLYRYTHNLYTRTHARTHARTHTHTHTHTHTTRTRTLHGHTLYIHTHNIHSIHTMHKPQYNIHKHTYHIYHTCMIHMHCMCVCTHSCVLCMGMVCRGVPISNFYIFRYPIFIV